MSTRQYIGARYVIKVYENSQNANSAEWEQNVTYEPLTMVTYNNSSYLSKKDVPPTVGDPAQNPSYWVITGAYNGQIANLQSQIDALSNLKPLINGYVSTSDFDSVNDAVEFAHDNSINLVIFGRDEVITKPICLYDNMTLDGAGHTLNCDPTFAGTRAITNKNSGYWNADNSLYAAYDSNLGVNNNITVKNIILGVFYRTNYDANGNDIGINTKPRNWLAFDSIKNLTIENLKSGTSNAVESYIWNTQAENVIVRDCDLTTAGYAGVGGIYWQYTRFDSNAETVNSNAGILVENCILESAIDEVIAIRSYDIGTMKNVLINNCKMKSDSGQAITIDANQGTPENVIISNCDFFNCAVRCTNRIEQLTVCKCTFKTDADNVSNQGYALRMIASAGININNVRSFIVIDSCYFDEYKNYAGPIWIELVNSLKIVNSSFIAEDANTAVAIGYGDVLNVNIAHNVIDAFSIAIQPYLSGTDVDWSHNVNANNAYNCDVFIDVSTRLRYTTIANNTLSKCDIAVKYHGVQFKDNLIDSNYAETITKFIEMASGTATAGVSLIRDNFMINDAASDNTFFDNQISFTALHFINNYWQSFNAMTSHLYPNT